MKTLLRSFTVILICTILIPQISIAQRNKKSNEETEKTKTETIHQSSTYSALKFRGIGPAFASGRVADLAMNPDNPAEYYVGVAAGNVWKTENNGITWKPIFDNYGSWSIADVEIDPNNHNIIWVGTGEYNSQRAIGYGDGVYVSFDRGKSFKNVGLKDSEHIGRIAIDPRNSHVYVAAQGPLWGPGGDRGLYKTTDYGKNWELILEISENTGVTDIVMDPRNPDILYCATYQRRRRVWTQINGGPESAIYKSIDAGKTWKKLTKGLPGGDVGRIGLTISPVNPDYVYAIIELPEYKGGTYRTTDRGASWTKMSDYVASSPQYYNRIYADPVKLDRLFSMDTYSRISDDGGKTWRRLGLRHRHVDDHAIWIDPNNNNHLIIGGDGGIYETYDLGSIWDFKENLPITQFYRVAVDNSTPFYFIYGGTQDNNSMGGPSATIRYGGIVNDDWYVTKGGDGFQARIDPTNPNIVYSQSQYGHLNRYDKASGEKIIIQPQPKSGEAYRWNWNSPLIISPHNPERLYFACQKLLMSDNRGSSWTEVSPDLTRQINRNELKVMGKVQSPEAVAKNRSTSLYGTITALDESPLVEGLLYVGTDDGLIQVSENGGQSWRTIDKIADVPETTYVDYIIASQHDPNTVYACFDGRKNNDLKPYIYKSTDKGNTWTRITANLPERGTVYTIAEDHIKSDLLFIGTEFGFWFTIDGGNKWIKLKNGLPTIQVRDIAIQKRENDIVLATFGRGFYVLDNYSMLREITPEILEKQAHIFDIKDALLYIQAGSKGSMGSSRYTAKNPTYGATFTIWLSDEYTSLKAERKKEEKEKAKNEEDIDYPSWEELEAEDIEKKPYLLVRIYDANGEKIRDLTSSWGKGMKTVTWDLRYPSTYTISSYTNTNRSSGYLVLPGKYTIELFKIENAKVTPLNVKKDFVVKSLDISTFPAADKQELLAFQRTVENLSLRIRKTNKLHSEMKEGIEMMRKAVLVSPDIDLNTLVLIDSLENELYELSKLLYGNTSISKRQGSQPPSINERLGNLRYSFYTSLSSPTGTMREQYETILLEYPAVEQKLNELYNGLYQSLRTSFDNSNTPYIPGKEPVNQN